LTSYSIKKLASFQDDLQFPIGFDQRGYLFCQYEENFESAKTFGEQWAKNGVRIEFLDAAEVEKKVPGLKAGIDHIDPDVNDLPPVIPLKRMLYITNFPPIEGFDRIPMTIIDQGIYFRPEGPNLLIGRADPETEPGYDVTADAAYYEEKINYIMQERVPGMER